ncbi:MAG: hypothetical protein RIC55_34705 [Pirellulaceae bacterium]
MASGENPPNDPRRRFLYFAWGGNALLTALAIVVAVVWSYAMFFRDYRLPGAAPPAKGEEVAESPYAIEARKRLEKHSDEIMRESAGLAAEVLPSLGKALAVQAREDYPLYFSTLEDEGDLYLANVEQTLSEKVKEQYPDFLREHREVLAEEFPEHADKKSIDALIGEFETLADNLVERYYLDEFRSETKRTIAVWKQIEPLDPPQPDEPSLQQQLTDYAADWSVLAFTDTAQERIRGD